MGAVCTRTHMAACLQSAPGTSVIVARRPIDLDGYTTVCIIDCGYTTTFPNKERQGESGGSSRGKHMYLRDAQPGPASYSQLCIAQCSRLRQVGCLSHPSSSTVRGGGARKIIMRNMWGRASKSSTQYVFASA